MAKKNVLGKGLGALIKQSETITSETQAYSTDKIDIQKIEVNPYQPRTSFNSESLEELAVSIKQLGIIQPITVREIEDGKYQIISGERRYRASLIAGLAEIPAYIRQAEDNNMLEMALVENIQREDLDAIEVAISYQRLIDECQLTQEDVSERVGMKRSTIANYLRLLKLPAEIQMAIRHKQISMGHARALINIEQTESQLQLLKNIVENGLSVRQVETAARQITNPEPEKAAVETHEIVFSEPEPVSVSEKEENIEEQTNIFQSVKETDKLPEDTIENQIDKAEQYSEKEIPIFEEQLTPACIPNNGEEHLKARLSKRFGTRVEIKRDATGAGRLVIPFRTDAELQYILQMTEK